MFANAPRRRNRAAGALLFAVIGVASLSASAHVGGGSAHGDEADPIVNCGIQCVPGMDDPQNQQDQGQPHRPHP